MERCAGSLPFLVAGVTSVTAGRTARHTLQNQARLADDDARADVVLQNVALDTEEKSRCDEKKRRKRTFASRFKGNLIYTTKAGCDAFKRSKGEDVWNEELRKAKKKK